MSFREKSAWTCLVTTVGVFGVYFAYVFRLFEQRELTTVAMFAAFSSAVVVQVVLIIAVSIGLAIQTPEVRRDERDVAIDSTAYRNAYSVFALACWTAISILALSPASTPAREALTPAFMSQVLLLCFVVAELARYLTQVVCYRRGR